MPTITFRVAQFGTSDDSVQIGGSVAWACLVVTASRQRLVEETDEVFDWDEDIRLR